MTGKTKKTRSKGQNKGEEIVLSINSIPTEAPLTKKEITSFGKKLEKNYDKISNGVQPTLSDENGQIHENLFYKFYFISGMGILWPLKNNLQPRFRLPNDYHQFPNLSEKFKEICDATPIPQNEDSLIPHYKNLYHKPFENLTQENFEEVDKTFDNVLNQEKINAQKNPNEKDLLNQARTILRAGKLINFTVVIGKVKAQYAISLNESGTVKLDKNGKIKFEGGNEFFLNSKRDLVLKFLQEYLQENFNDFSENPKQKSPTKNNSAKRLSKPKPKSVSKKSKK